MARRFWGRIGKGLLSAIGVSLAFSTVEARAQDFQRSPGESDLAFAGRALKLSGDADPHVLATTWNGAPTLFVDYDTDSDDPERPLVALLRQPSGAYRKVDVTLGEQEGGIPDIEAIGFANADRDPAKELIVILKWNTQHYDVGGSLYEVRIFDDPKPGQKALAQLKISEKFGTECDCTWRDGSSKHFRFKTIAAVKAELKRMGY